MNDQAPLLFLARTNFRDRRRIFGMRQRDRFAHLYVIGQTGTGKSTLLEFLIRQDAAAGRGFSFLDPHGDSVRRLANFLTSGLRQDVLYLDAPEPSCPIAFNPLESVPLEQRALAASGIIEAFKNVWGQWWGPRLEHWFRNGLLTLLDQPASTLADMPRLFADDAFRKVAIARVTHPAVRDFWFQEYAKYSVRYRAEALSPLLNKLGAFLAQPTLYRILTKPRSGFDCREVMDSGKILLVNLAKGRMGSDACSLLGALLVTRIGLAALSRADIPETSRRDHFLYLDEFQNFTTLSVATMLSELRKYRLGMILAHQYVAQLAPEVREAVFGNVGSMITFRIGPEDARFIEKWFEGEFSALDLMKLPNFNIYVRLQVDGAPVNPFSAETLMPHE